jgi:hypothetical protein
LSSAPGLIKVGNGNTYESSVETKLVVSVSGKMADGKVASDKKKVFRIKGIPSPTVN